MLSSTGEKIFKMKYAVDENERWEDACLRVASYIASAEKAYGATDNDINELTNKYFQMMYNLYFVPGGRVLANAGTEIKNLMNCFVLPVEDSRSGIYGTLKDAAEIFAWGGGIGYNFSNVREEGAPIKTTKGSASGPLSFMTLFDQTGEVIQQASRRGAQMGMLNIDHPDIEKFIEFKSEPNTRNTRLLEEYHRNLSKMGERLKNTKYYDVLRKTLLDDQLTHFNISVVLNDEFIQNVISGKDHHLISRSSKEAIKAVPAVDLLMRMANRAWESGDPGVFFYDRANEDNMVPYIGNLEVTNPCGEVPLLYYEACNLGSINLSAIYDDEHERIDWAMLEDIVRLGVRFLDDVQEASFTPLEKVNYYSKGLRRIGLGVMGLADLLAKMEISYNSETHYKLSNYISWFISFFAWQESIELAKQRGPFPFFDPEKVNRDVLRRVFDSPYVPNGMEFDVDNMIVRNVSVTSVAPTGSIALIAGVNSAIEPFFALAYKRFITEGVGNTAKDAIIEINPILFDKLKKYSLSDKEVEDVKRYVIKNGTLDGCDLVPENVKKVFVTSHGVHWSDHIRVQSAWQQYVSNAVSKTINCPHDTTKEEIFNIYLSMWLADLKGGTIYRDGSKLFQILNAGSK